MHNSTIIAVVLFCVVCLSGTAMAGGFRAIAGTGLFRRVSDRISTAYLFHGVNIVHKGTGLGDITTSELVQMKSIGFNVVRFGFLWSNVEPLPGVYNSSYIELMKSDVDLLWSYGFHVFLDMHQDCYSAFFCSGADGVPLFYGHPPNASEYQANGSKAFPLPFFQPQYVQPQPPGFAPYGASANCGHFPVWALCYTTFALGAATQRLYSNADGLQQAMGRMWQRIARAFASHPAVLGYELINEPWLGKVPLTIADLDPAVNPEFYNLWDTGVADKKNLQPLYNTLSSMIRHVDNGTALFFEPVSGGSLIDTRVGFTHGPGGTSYDVMGLNVLSYHVYCPLIQTDIPIPNNSSNQIWRWLWKELSLDICKSLGRNQFKDRSADAMRLGLGGFLTEFGAIPHTRIGASSMSTTLDQVDAILHSWTFWAIEILNNAPAFVQEALTRSYPMRVPGTLTSFSSSISPATNKTVFVAEYVLPRAVAPAKWSSDGNALFFLNPLHFPNAESFSFSALPPCCVKIATFNATSGILIVHHAFNKLPPQSIVRVTLHSEFR